MHRCTITPGIHNVQICRIEAERVGGIISDCKEQLERLLMTLRDLGEFGAIHRLSQRAVGARSKNATDASELLVDIGDDTAAWRAGGIVHLWTTDTMVEGVHFIPGRTASWEDVGWKIMAVNLSDIASMGGDATYALVTLGMPADACMDDLDMMYKGMTDLASACGVSIIGGDMVGAEKAFVTIGLLGTCNGEPMVRSAAKPGDLIAVTGEVGSSAGGLKLLLDEDTVEQDAYEFLSTAHRRPTPRLEEGRALAAIGVRAAMDISDGLMDDLGKLCHASGVAAGIEAATVPVSPHLKTAFPNDCLTMALSGGEDCQLVFTAPEETMATAISSIPGSAVIGKIVEGTPGRVSAIGPDGKEIEMASGGWDHYE